MPISLLTSLSCEIYSDVRKHPLNSKPIPQIDPTNYLALFRRCCSLKIRYQTFSVVMGERNPFFLVSAPGLLIFLLKTLLIRPNFHGQTVVILMEFHCILIKIFHFCSAGVTYIVLFRFVRTGQPDRSC